jgi:TRAP transporter TAXI family solute receptor
MAQKRICFVLSMVLAITAFLPILATGEASAAQGKIRLSLGAASTGTWIYMYCAALADMWQRNIPGLDITVLATAGTSANYIPLDKGELDLAGASVSADWYAMKGLYFTKTKLSNFCSMLPATKSFYQTFTYGESPIQGWKDLDGKKVYIGARASPTSINAEEICKTLGIKPRYVYATPSEGVDMIKDRRVDAIIYGVGAPWSAIMDVATEKKIKFIPMTAQEQKKVVEALPYLRPAIMPAKTYSFQTEPLPLMIGVQTMNVRSGLAEEIVYRLTKTAWQNWDELAKGLAAIKWVKPADMAEMLAPLHPGAAKYYREVGVQIPDNLVWRKK